MRIKINAQSQGATMAPEAAGLRLSTPSTAGLCLPGLLNDSCPVWTKVNKGKVYPVRLFTLPSLLTGV